MKKAKILVFAMSLLLFLTACTSKEKPFANRDGSILSFTDIPSLEDGYYIYKSTGKAQPLLEKGLGTVGDKQVVWFRDFDNLIPVMEEGDSLIIVRSNRFQNNTPATFTKMRDIGWTIGTNFNVSVARKSNEQAMTVIRFGEQVSPYSRAGAAIAAVMQGDSDAQLLDINGQNFAPNMLSPSGILQGLTKDAMYQFRYYVGTKYNLINMKADTHVFEEERSIQSSEYVEEQSTYFTVPMPKGLEKGYYVVDGFGMFFYNAGEFKAD